MSAGVRCLLSIGVCASVVSGCGMKQPMYAKTQLVMGTMVEVVSPSKEAPNIVFREMRRIEQELSYFIVHSDVAHLNRHGEVDAGEDLLFVLSKARRFWEASWGAFDITVAPLLDVWGFRGEALTIPDEETLRETLALVGMDKILVRPSGTVEFKVPGMMIDLGGIGKGYAIDRAVEKLRENGIDSCLINCGGQVYGLGRKIWGPWKAAVRDARSDRVRGTVVLTDLSASTSGDYEQFYLEEEIRLSHILSPATGRPAHSGIISVTVTAPSALDADALSTAVFVLGQERGAELVAQFPGARIADIQVEATDTDVSHS